MDRTEFLSRTASTLDLIFVPSSVMRWAGKNKQFDYGIVEDFDAYIFVGVIETIRLGLEVGAVASLVHYLSN